MITKHHKKTATLATLLLFVAVFLIIEFSRWRRNHQAQPLTTIPHALQTNRAQELTPEEQWLRNHYPTLLSPGQKQALYKSLIDNYWVPQTGIFLSFPRTGDIRLVQQAATYDQGIIGVLLLKLGELNKVKRMLMFYEAAWASATERSGPRQGVYGLANFYNAFFKVEGIEKTMHVGPNAWIGLLASRYYRTTGDKKALDLALGIARWIITKVPHTDGAVAMGQILWNSAPWDKIYSTENNLSTYAFLGDLLKNKKLAREDRELIKQEHSRIGQWLLTKAYQPQTRTILRGFHPHGIDRAGAIDSYTWFISSLRPSRLHSAGIPAEALISRAEKDFAVHVGALEGVDAVDSIMAENTYADAVQTHYKDVNFLRPSGDGHRLIWYEGTGQFIVALEDMAQHTVHLAFQKPPGPKRDALLNKASAWLEEARVYTQAMDKAKIDSPLGTSYPCATTGRFYLYGWPAPAPLDGHMADASAPLVWRLFAGMAYEPLSDTQLGPQSDWHVAFNQFRSVRNPGTEILYGASEEMMVYAWQLYEKGDKNGAMRQANATISLWEDDARGLEKTKEAKVGTYLPFDGTVMGYQNIHDYWALNDVASCYFILAKIADERQDYPQANQHLSKILRDFHLAQMWDKRGWFWNPVDTIQQDFIEVHPDHYANLASLIPDIPALTFNQLRDSESSHASSLAKNVVTSN